MTSYGGFTWPETGDVVCPDWDPAPICGNGLHGLLLGCGNGHLLSWAMDAKWLVVEVEKDDIVALGGKVKVPKGAVIFCGTRLEALAKLEALAPECLAMSVVGATRTANEDGVAKVGDWGTALALVKRGHATAGYRGTAMAGDYGTATAGDFGRATAGYRGEAVAGFEGIATAGYSGHATAGRQGTAIVGDGGTAVVGLGGRAQAGFRGNFLMEWWDTKTKTIVAIKGYVGENGIEPHKPYRVALDTGALLAIG